MKSLSLSRPLVLMMLGIPGSGKSFFAGQFSETFGAPLLSVDRLRRQIIPEPRYSKEEDALLWDIILSETQELLKTKKTFIIDGGTHTKVARAAVSRLAKAAGYDTLLIWVQTDEVTAKTRATKQQRTSHLVTPLPPLSPEIFTARIKRFSKPSPLEKQVVISGKHTYATQAKVVLRKLVEGREPVPQRRQIHVNPHHDQSHATTPPKRRNLTIN